MRTLVLLAGLASLTGCFDFPGLLSGCRDDAGVWRCGEDGGAAQDAGVDDAGVDRGQLVCLRGWCWESPYPFGGELNAVAAGPAGEMWFGSGELVAHLQQDGGWSSTAIPGFAARALCVSGEQVLVGGRSVSSTSSLYQRVGGAWAPVGQDFFGAVGQLSCTGTHAFVGSSLGVHSWNGTTLAHRVAPPSGGCGGVLAEGDGCLAACTEVDDEAVRIYRCDGGVEYEELDAGRELRKLWRDGLGAARVAVSGPRGEVWVRDAGSWSVASAATTFFDPYGGTALGTGSLAVGQRLAWTTDTTGGMVSVQTSSTAYFFDATTDAWGIPWTVGSHGLIARFEAGAWQLLEPTRRATLFDLTFEGGLHAFGEEALTLERSAGRWRERVTAGTTDDFLAAWAEPGTGTLAVLTPAELRVDGLAPISLSPAQGAALFVFSRARALVATTGGLYEVSLEGSTSKVLADPHVFTALTGELGTGRAWGSNAQGVWVAGTPSWEPVPNAPQEVVALDVAGGALWGVTSDGHVARFIDGSWLDLRVTDALSTLVALSSTEALVFQSSLEPAAPASSHVWRLTAKTNGLVAEPLGDVPARVTRARAFGGEVWVVGADLSILRYTLP